MPALSLLAAFLQDDATLVNDVHSLMIAQWILVGCLLFVFLVFAIVGFVVLGIVRKAQKSVETAQAKAMPLIAQGQELLLKAQEIVAELQPKINSISSDVTHISSVVRSKVDEAGQTFTNVNSTVQDVNGKTKAQVARVNEMVSDALTTTEQVSRQIQHGIKVPIQKITEWVATAKAGIEHLSERLPFLHHEQPRPTGRPVETTYGARPTSAPGSGMPASGSAAPGGPPFVPSPSRTRG